MAKISKEGIKNWLKVRTSKVHVTRGNEMAKILIIKDDVPGYVNVSTMNVQAPGGIPSVLYIGDVAFMLHGQYPNAVYYPASVGMLKDTDVEWAEPHIDSGHPDLKVVKK